jgi:hypothetical protein
VLPSSAIGFGISLRGKNSRQPIALTCTDSSDATVGASPGAVAGTEEAEPPSQNASGFASPQATLSGYWLTGGVFELQYSCSGAGGYLLHTWFRDASGQVCTSPSARPDPPPACKRSPWRPVPPLACKRSPRRAAWVPPQVHELPGSPHALTVSSTAADARGCTLFDAGARMHKTTQVAGTKLHAFIQVADRFGNSCLPQPGQC